jgi:predicted nucleotidyltransferase component of viral defense system
MKDHLHELVSQTSTTAEAGLIVREYLQARVLEALQRAGAFSTWAFLGGTALRFLFRLPRFSEDLDFSRIGVEPVREKIREEFEHSSDRVVADVRPFLEQPADLALLERENVLQLLKR